MIGNLVVSRVVIVDSGFCVALGGTPVVSGPSVVLVNLVVSGPLILLGETVVMVVWVVLGDPIACGV